ncbi:MAG TPA: penicillin-binding protein 1C [Eoetvoesiella sp.]
MARWVAVLAVFAHGAVSAASQSPTDVQKEAGRIPLLSQAVAPTVSGLPSYPSIKDQFRASDVLVLDRRGQLLQRLRSNFQVRRGDWVSLHDVSPALVNAVLMSEDRRFYSHSGVDWQAVLAAAWDNLLLDQRRGASTVSMQLVGLIDEQLRGGSSGRSVMQKIGQALEARTMERHWTKAQILEAYLNLAPFRGELVGVDALSSVLFGKHASGLDMRESALAAAMLRAPNASQAVLEHRACGLLQAMAQSQECKGLADFIQRSFVRRPFIRANSNEFALHYAQWVLRQAPRFPGESIVTSLDATLQRVVVDIVQRHLYDLQASHVSDAAVVVLDNATGHVIAYVGSSGDLSQAAQVDHAQALRQAGSTLKPFLYAQAIEQERLTPVSLLDDGPLNLPTGNGLYIPQNYDRHFSGWVSVRTALASSLNIPAVRTLVMVTPDAFQQRLVQFGLPLDRSGDFYGYSLALGSADVSLLALTNAYRALANEGRYSPVQLLPSVGAQSQISSRSVVSAAAAWIVGDILSDRHARARTFGLSSPLTTAFWSAVKTGTSKDMRDNWCVGWSQRYTVGVWVGNSGGASMRDVSGVSGAGPVWHEIMAYLHRVEDSVQTPVPAGVEHQWVTFENNIEPAREDVFVGDTALSFVRLSHQASGFYPARPAISQPADQTILALDPDIPPAHQRLWFRAKNVSAQQAPELFWRIGKNTIGRGREAAWLPQPGRHRVELVSVGSQVLDGITIEVRGASLNSLLEEEAVAKQFIKGTQ